MVKSTSNSKSSSSDGMKEPGRRDFIVVATYAMGAVGAGAVAWPLIDQMNPAADTLALASTEVLAGGRPAPPCPPPTVHLTSATRSARSHCELGPPHTRS